MLKTATKTRRVDHPTGAFDVEIAGIATAVPAHKLSQDDAANRAKSIFPQLALHDSLFGNTGIETRYACQPPEWFLDVPRVVVHLEAKAIGRSVSYQPQPPDTAAASSSAP
jgi:hypothetical protein